jgi:hypothetical protein
MIRKSFAALVMLAVAGLAVANAQTVPNSQTTYPISTGAPPEAFGCVYPGQSSAVVEVAATTIPGPTPTPVATGTPTAGPTSTPVGYGTPTVTLYSATDRAGKPGPSASPYLSESKSGTSASTIVGSGKLYLKLHGDQWVIAILSGATPGQANITVTCTSATAYIPFHGEAWLERSLDIARSEFNNSHPSIGGKS